MRLLLPEAREVSDDDLPDLYAVTGPHLRGGLIASLDGGVAIDGTSGALGSAGDRAVLRALRTVADAVLVGAGTVRSENYGPLTHRPAAAAWRARAGLARQAVLVVVSRTGRLDPAGRLGDGPGPVLLAVPPSAEPVAPPGVEVLRVESGPGALIEALAARGLTRLLCEGGPELLTSFAQEGLLDELCLTAAPYLLGAAPHLLAAPLAAPVRLALVSLLHDEPDHLLARWSVVRPGGGAQSPE